MDPEGLTTHRTPVGAERCYRGTIEVLYPGERAEVVAPVVVPIAHARADGGFVVSADAFRWHVSPEPGLGGWWRRTRFRLTRALGWQA